MFIFQYKFKYFNILNNKKKKIKLEINKKIEKKEIDNLIQDIKNIKILNKLLKNNLIYLNFYIDFEKFLYLWNKILFFCYVEKKNIKKFSEIYLPKKKKIFFLLNSVFIHKKSQKNYQILFYKLNILFKLNYKKFSLLYNIILKKLFYYKNLNYYNKNNFIFFFFYNKNIYINYWKYYNFFINYNNNNLFNTQTYYKKKINIIN